MWPYEFQMSSAQGLKILGGKLEIKRLVPVNGRLSGKLKNTAGKSDQINSSLATA